VGNTIVCRATVFSEMNVERICQKMSLVVTCRAAAAGGRCCGGLGMEALRCGGWGYSIERVPRSLPWFCEHARMGSPKDVERLLNAGG